MGPVLAFFSQRITTKLVNQSTTTKAAAPSVHKIPPCPQTTHCTRPPAVAYGVITAPRVGSCRHPLRPSCRKGQSIPGWYELADCWYSTFWTLRSQYVQDLALSAISLTIADRTLLNIPLVGVPASAALAYVLCPPAPCSLN